MSDDVDLLLEQIEYYRARAPEYDDWFERRGRYDRGPDATGRWFAEVEEVKTILRSVPLDGADILELAPGTGIWTEQLVHRAARLTVVDAADEMIDATRARLGSSADAVTYVQADLFSWEPDREYDAVVFCFWISHVPDARIDRFLAGARSMLRAGGSVFFVDGRREPTSTATDHVLPSDGVEVMTRRLVDGREFQIVKRFRASADLERRCRAAGLDVTVDETATYFQYGVGTAAQRRILAAR